MNGGKWSNYGSYGQNKMAGKGYWGDKKYDQQSSEAMGGVFVFFLVFGVFGVLGVFGVFWVFGVLGGFGGFWGFWGFWGLGA